MSARVPNPPPAPHPPALVAALAQPSAYPWHPPAVELIETHVSWVFLAGNFVVKVKRPVHFGFVDHRQAAARRASCEAEVRLNRRLTAGVYLDVVPITAEPGGGFAVDGVGTPVEWGTLMRRLPAERMLDRLLEAGAAPPDLAGQLAARLIPFHTSVAEERGAEPEGQPEALLRVVTDNLAELAPFAGPLLSGRRLDRVAGAMHRFIAANGPRFARRSAGGFVRDGHGDLRCEHVCLEPDTVQIFDCVEFNQAIRTTDIASDLAFLLMDLERLGAPAAAKDLTERYRAAGVDLPADLLRFYRAHRALVRAKVACLADPVRVDDARAYLDRATRCVLPTGPALILCSGLSGVGKSTAAAAIAAATGADVHASDRVRKELAGVAGSAADSWQAGIYAPEWTARTYASLAELANGTLRTGRAALLDASFATGEQRLAAAAVASRAGAPLVIVEVRCDEEVARARLAARTRAGGSISDADWAVHQRQRAAWAAEPPAIPAGARHVVIDTTHANPDWIEPVFEALAESGALPDAIPASD